MKRIMSCGDLTPRPPSLLGKGLGVRFFAPVVLLALALAVGAAPITDWVSTTSTIAVYAQAGTGYDLTWNTVDDGGITFATGGGGYTLSGTAGQPDAATWSGSGGYTLAGGFWHAALANGASGGETQVYLPVILKNR